MKHLFISLLLLAYSAIIQAQPGTLDKSFREGGVLITLAQVYINYSAIQADNKTIVSGLNSAGDFLLIRYNTDGTVDKSFGKEGMVSTPFSQYYKGDGWTNVKVQPDGKIVAAGTNYTIENNNYPPYNADIALARFNTDGSPDLSFGKNGVVITDFGEYESATAMALQSDGRIIITGIYSIRGTGYDTKFLTVRYNKDGSLDNSFGGNGYVVYPGSGADNAYAVAVQSDGKIVVGGDYQISRYFMLLRYNEDGSLDKTFGTNGFVNTKIITDGEPTDESINSLTIDKEERIVAAGTCLNVAMAIARYKPDGSLDSSFNKDGKQVLQLSQAFSEAKTVLLLKDERILVVGDASGDITSNLALACLKPDGSLDSSFGANGITISDFGSDENVYNAVLQTDGKIVVASSYESGNLYSYLLARYNGYDPGKQPLTVRIKRWLLHHGISWQVQPNKDVRYYAVQRSADGIVYKEIARISGTQAANTYEDKAPLNNSYYRLMAVAKDGSKTYSNTVLIDESANVKIFPNPVRDNLQLQGLATGKTNVSIVDLQGNVRSLSVASGANYSVNTSQLTPGNYLLKLQHNNVTTTLPFVKE